MIDGSVPASALVRLRGPSGRVVGTAFLVAADLVVTCAHVVAAALGHPGPEPPAGALTAEFPLLDDDTGAGRRAVVVGWQPRRADGSGDSAVLRLDRPAPPDARPARLTRTEPAWGDEVRVFGFPADLPEGFGVWVEAELRARQGAGWLQLESPPHRRAIGPGFSGAPVWSPTSGGVVGMVVAAERSAHTTTSYLIPTQALVDAHPEIAAPDPAETCPYRGLAPFLEEHATHFRGREALVERMLAQVRQHPLLTLAGPSGSGKSSLVYAGLIPRLRERGTLVAGFRPLPGVRPAALLAGAVIGVLEPDLGELRRHDEATALADRLDTSVTDTLPWLAGRLADRAGDGGLLIFGDQFEELPTDDARELWRLLHRLVRATPRRPTGGPGILVALTMRSGTLDALVTDDTAAEATDGVVFVPPMSREQLRAAVTAADVDFESGLVERILDDAGTAPGHLPLVEFTLARLWERRTAGTLTHRAYEEIGGVSGALARYAEDVYRHLPPERRPEARRLLVQLARPEADGGFLRRPVRLAHLGDESGEVLARLVASRLVVVGRGTDGTEVADLAHQALIAHWPELHGWLTEERDFRTWQEELRADLARWEADGRDPGGLLRGVPLATAERWRREHPAGISPAEHAYLRSSRAREQRRIRVLWTVVAVISVLALAATGLAVVAARQTAQADARLRTAASRALADDANRTRQVDPRMSLQLAQAAWHHDRSAEAYGALFSWYAATQSVDAVYQDSWDGDLRRIATSRDGDVVVFENATGRPAVWTGMAGPHPREVFLPSGGRTDIGGTWTLSPSGGTLAYANARGSVLLWDVERTSGPVVLADTPLDPDPAVQFTVASVSFAADGSRVMVRWALPSGDSSVLRVWDTASGTPVAIVNPIGAGERPGQVSFGPDPGTLVVSSHVGPTHLYDLRTGRRLRSFPVDGGVGDAIVRYGAAVTRCDDDRLRVLDTATGREVVAVSPGVRCSAYLDADVGTDYAVFAGHADDAVNTDLTIVDLRSGRVYRVAAPPVSPVVPGSVGLTVAVSGPDGRPVTLLGGKNLGYRLRAADPFAASGPARPAAPGSVRVTGPRGRYELTVDGESGRIELTDVATRKRLGSASAPPPPDIVKVMYNGLWVAFSPDGTRLAAVHSGSLVVYALPGLAVTHRLALPVPPDIGTPPPPFGADDWSSSVLFDTDGRVVVLHAGVLTRWDVASGTRVDEPLPVRADVDGLARSAVLAYLGRQPRPGRAGEVAVVQPSGDVEVWSVPRRDVVVRLEVSAARNQGAVVFHPEGTRMAVQSSNGDVTVWDVDSGRSRGGIIPTGPVDSMLGFTGDSGLVTVGSAGAPGAKLWDERTGKLLAALPVASTENAPLWSLTGGTLSSVQGSQVRTLPLDPEQWMRRLCGLSDRPYTPDEREVIGRHSGTTGKPCP
ncbi:trypsin-like peptidase domain-containing protein [Micromonospora cathayae]|uniref:Trypsin-like peptidase domain-containing protein n=1 Tax=Micromonospora cathayae TaxID=3028804 RepID=A0ABY7ZIX1_9ACTN|nr:trypsin-like peptidase domain-containing protein [Micromonospora sp. HUAS 3]WDZ82828.1 trypsin-like peptidase domain-containing protein [Micromonospora sp. HUAS 3]